MTAETLTRAHLSSIWPFSIVRDIHRALSFYRDQLGFDVAFLMPNPDPFFAIIRRSSSAGHTQTPYARINWTAPRPLPYP